MPNEIRTKLTAGSFTITLASLANGSARQSTLITGNVKPAAVIYLKIMSGAVAPTAGAGYEVYLIRGDGTTRTDGAGANDAAITILNAELLGVIQVTASTSTAFYGVFDTSRFGALGTEWGIAVKNVSGQALNTTEGNHVKSYAAYLPEVQ